MTTDKGLREALADRITAGGDLRSPVWRQAVLDIPRHEFLRDGFFRRTDEGGRTGWEPVRPEDPAWLQACYSDESLVTQIAGTVMPADMDGRIYRQPTSSSTLPGLVVRMLEELNISDSMKVLEIGTGTGYSTALLCHRLGDRLVTSVEVDPAVSGRARVSLGRVGRLPDLVVGDGLKGHPENAPYDRLIATCGVLHIPGEWIEQVKPGGQILATVGGWLYASELARLTVREDGTAAGRLLGGAISFMLARPQSPPPLGILPDMTEGEEREAVVAGDALEDWTARFVAQLAAPGAQRFGLTDEEGPVDVLLDVERQSWAALRNGGGRRWLVRQGGPDRLWDRIEEHLTRWREDGAPGLDRFLITARPGGQTITWAA
ncbi:ATP-grasp peptide maturase system methyltransferase [Streptomyces sp. GMY02]|uniref:ATP-grasp peptide maturase system methyltransferase n=1 Tax=Streptomyces sp. GMY02 TaxID=1333528 RepID=UPI001C2C96A2|nr:ATP-grasp peptide maturase system methyltransferase [Streptomyces sp. GMY02]QXE35021.1 ATP-grasp peptide maturase system methyltransferase [Streptomyces sp. GMY02]